jgi:hypothetical protein
MILQGHHLHGEHYEQTRIDSFSLVVLLSARFGPLKRRMMRRHQDSFCHKDGVRSRACRRFRFQEPKSGLAFGQKSGITAVV